MSNKILVVEDSFIQRQMIADLLQASQFSVTTAKDGIEALEKISLTCPDLVVLDIIMPQLNGFEICRRIKANPNTKHIPVILCSSQGGASDLYWGFKQGADAYIIKPFKPKELIETVKHFCTQKPLIKSSSA